MLCVCAHCVCVYYYLKQVSYWGYYCINSVVCVYYYLKQVSYWGYCCIKNVVCVCVQCVCVTI